MSRKGALFLLLQERLHHATRTIMRQKTQSSPFAWSIRVREKRLPTAWKIYESEPFYGELP